MTLTQPLRSARIVAFGEVLLRLASEAPELLFQGTHMVPSFCGAEANAAVALAGFGHDTTIVTALPDNPVGTAAARAIGAMGPHVAGPTVAGGRMGLYYLQPGAMTRSSLVVYDRAGSALARSGADAYDWDNLLDGADWLFLSGITAALGERPLAAMHAAIEGAKSRKVCIAFDTNFRPTLWQGREAAAASILRDLTAEADLVFAGRRAARMMTGAPCDHDDPAEGFRAAADALFAVGPRLSHVAATRRNVHSTDRQDLTGLLADRDGVSTSNTIRLENIVDRVGTGDAFAAGIVHGLSQDMDRTATIDFAAACAQWAHSIPGDFLRASLADIESLSTSGDVRR